MSEKTDHLIKRLTETGDKILEYFRSLEADQWETVVHSSEQQWTVRTLLSHLVSSETSMTKLFQMIAGGHPGASEDFDTDRFNNSRAAKMADLTPGELLAQFEEAQQALIEWVGSVDDETLAIEGRHARVGVQPLEKLIKVVYIHNREHLDEVRTALEE